MVIIIKEKEFLRVMKRVEKENIPVLKKLNC